MPLALLQAGSPQQRGRPRKPRASPCLSPFPSKISALIVSGQEKPPQQLHGAAGCRQTDGPVISGSHDYIRRRREKPKWRRFSSGFLVPAAMGTGTLTPAPWWSQSLGVGDGFFGGDLAGSPGRRRGE